MSTPLRPKCIPYSYTIYSLITIYKIVCSLKKNKNIEKQVYIYTYIYIYICMCVECVYIYISTIHVCTYIH